MAKGKTKRRPVNKNFGKHVRICCTEEGSPYEAHTGTVISGNLDENGHYEVEFDTADGPVKAFVHANDLKLADDEPEQPETNPDPATKVIALQLKVEEVAARIAARGNITIKSAQLVDGMFCHFTYEESFIRDNAIVSNSVTKKSGLPMHDDLRSAFSFLPMHLAVICEELSTDDITDEEIESLTFQKEDGGLLYEVYSRYRVEKFAVKGNEEGAGVVLT